MVQRLKGKYGSGVDPLTHLGQNYMVVDCSLIPALLQILRNEEQFDYCVDITAVHYPKREKQFDVIWVLYSFLHNQRIRVKTLIADGETIDSSVTIWAAANWLEREVFDMFGIKFDGHPDLKRILLPDGWKGHPLRKDYGILQQDNEWVQINLGIGERAMNSSPKGPNVKARQGSAGKKWKRGMSPAGSIQFFVSNPRSHEIERNS